MTTPLPSGPQPADFDAWNEKKKQIHVSRRAPTFKQGEVWWCDLGVNVGSEQNGDTVSRNGQAASFRRPVLILKKTDALNCVVLPLTTQAQEGRYGYALDVKGRPNWVLLVHIRMLSAKRLTKYLVELPQDEFQRIRRACREALDL